MPVELVRYDAACRALAAAKAVDEVKPIHDVAAAMRAYAKQAKNRQLEVDAVEIRFRAERRIGELMQAQKAAGGFERGGDRRSKAASGPLKPITIAEVGIDRHLAERARKFAAVTSAEFERFVDEWKTAMHQETERVTTNLIRAGEREHTRTDRPSRPLPPGRFRLLYADPPWCYEHIETESRAIENHYPTMSLDDICALDVPAADDAVLFLWTTSPKVMEAGRVIDAWGFSYRTQAVWDKELIGMGYYFRQQHEVLCVAARGSMPVPAPALRPPSVLRARRSAIHSRKPAEMIERLEQMYPTFTESDRVELFAREARHGWAAWSNEPAEVIT